MYGSDSDYCSQDEPLEGDLGYYSGSDDGTQDQAPPQTEYFIMDVAQIAAAQVLCFVAIARLTHHECLALFVF